jgi:hypothetical protein
MRIVFFPAIICANNLRQLNVSRCDQFTDWHQLATLTILDKLVATDCDGLDDSGIAEVVESVPTLRSLDISGCFKVTHNVCFSPLPHAAINRFLLTRRVFFLIGA